MVSKPIIRSIFSLLSTKNGRGSQGEIHARRFDTRAMLGDLHEGMTATGSPPAAYGEAPQWLVQQLLTRSPPFTSGFTHSLTT